MYPSSFGMRRCSILYFHTFFRIILFKNGFILSHTYYWAFAFVHPNAQPLSILSFWSTSVKKILEDRKCIDVVLYHFDNSVRIAVGVCTHVVVSRSSRNQILSTNFVFFYFLVVIWIQRCIGCSSNKYRFIKLCLYRIVSFFSCLSM